MIIGRDKERKRLAKIITSKKSEFVAVYGRRRVGKTFLIREFFNYQFDFHHAGLANGNTIKQLASFHDTWTEYFSEQYDAAPKTWLEAFKRLKTSLAKKARSKKLIIFLDEMPWMDTPRSDFMIALESFWNGWATNRKNVILIACGSASSWVINELINNHGGLHNRVTQKFKIEPFTLKETEEMLLSKGCLLTRYQIAELYMALGGMPYYIEAITPGKSVAQIIEELFFINNAILKNEFSNLYRSFFRKYEAYENVVAALAQKLKGINRNEIVKATGLPSGGTLTKILQELEESSFIASYTSLETKAKLTLYRLSDFYTAFYFKFIKSAKYRGEGAWTHFIDNPSHRAWQGYTFEQLCMAHIHQIKKALGISGILSSEASWQNDKTQIDLLIDRRDQVINLCEMKYSMTEFTINKDYANQLKKKISIFKQNTKTKKAVFLTLITTYGVEKNAYALELVQNEVLLDELFE